MEEKRPSEISEEVLSAKKHHGPVRPGPCSPRGCPPPTEIVCIKTKKVYQECKQVEPIERVEVYGLYIPPATTEVECVKVCPGVISCEDAGCQPPQSPLPPGFHLREDTSEEVTERGKKQKKKTCVCECMTGDGTVTLEEIKDFPIQITVEFFDRNGMSLGEQTGWAKICIPEKTVCLSRAGEPQLKCEVDIFLSCVMCIIKEEQANTLKSAAEDRHVSVPEPVQRVVSCCINKVIVFKLVAEVQLMVPSYGFCPEPCDCEEIVAGECPEAEAEWPPYPEPNGKGGCKSCK